MNHSLFLQKLEDFKKYLGSSKAIDSLFLWESIANFQSHWSSDIDLRSRIDNSLTNQTSKRLWVSSGRHPKIILLGFAEQMPEMLEWTFKDLFSLEKDVEGRLGRFTFHMDQMYEDWKKENPETIFDSHYHDDNYKMASTYLSLIYPNEYCPYNLDLFQDYLRVLKSNKIPLANDLNRYFKLMKTTLILLKKDEQIEHLHSKRLRKGIDYQGDIGPMLSYEFAHFCCNRMI